MFPLPYETATQLESTPRQPDMSAATELRTTGDRQAPSNLSTSSDSHQEHKETLDLQVEAGRAPSQVDGCSPLMPPVTLGGALIYLVSFGLLNTWGTFQARYSQHELAHHSVDAVAWIGSVQVSLGCRARAQS